jgi:uncharacterized protein
MKKIIVLLLLLCAGVHSFAIEYPERPNPPRLVNDFTNTLTPEEVNALEQKLVRFNDSTSIQIAVVILTSLEGYPIGQYATELGQKWGVGEKKTNNGAMLLIAMRDHEVAISTGYGLEAAMPDALCRRIIENDIKPNFKQDEYYQGIEAGTNQMIALVKGEYKDTPVRRGKKQGPSIYTILFIAFVVILIMVFKVRSVRRYSLLNNIPFFVAWQLLNSAANRSSGRWSDFSGGGGFGGGGSGGGGFGGFGGGSFGGGGASGSW